MMRPKSVSTGCITSCRGKKGEPRNIGHALHLVFAFQTEVDEEMGDVIADLYQIFVMLD